MPHHEIKYMLFSILTKYLNDYNSSTIYFYDVVNDVHSMLFTINDHDLLDVCMHYYAWMLRAVRPP